MKLRLLTLVLLTTIASAGLFTKASAQSYYGHGNRRSYTVYPRDTAFEKDYENDYDYYSRHYHPRKYYRNKYRAERHYHEYYYTDKARHYSRYRDDKYYYRGGGY